MTSNAGSDNNGTLLGFNKTQAEASKDKALKALREFLRPEFLGRVDDIIAFAPLGKESLEKIAALILDELKPILAERHISFSYDSKVCTYFAEKCDGKSGARELRKMVRKEIEDKIIATMIDNPELNFKYVTVKCNNIPELEFSL